MNELKSPTRSFLDCRSDIARDGTVAKSGAAKNNEIDPLLHPGRVAKILDVSPSWLAKARMNGTGPRFIKIGRTVRYAQSAVREFILSRQRMSTAER
jgi:predicted DNA-binding transcriptional regulator AlpA